MSAPAHPMPAAARFCHLCGRALSPAARAFHHPAWPPGVDLHVCEVCLAAKPRCPVCRQPAAADGLCPTCREVGPLCAACGRRIHRRAAHIGDHGPYCADCMAGPRCESCGLPAGRNTTAVDGRVTCATCRATAVSSAEEAAPIFRAVEGVVRDQLGLALNVPTGLTLVTPKEMEAILSDMGEDPHSGGNTLGIYTRRGRRRGIYALSGLPRLLLLQVAAHEWAHAWQMESAPLLRDPVLREGFAEWVAYRVLHALGESDTAERALLRQDAYGQGLRHLLGIEEQVGPRGVIEWCRRAR